MTDSQQNIGKLFERIAKISGELGALQKDAKNTQQNYSYFSADAIMGHINGLMKENGLVVIPMVKDVSPIESKEGIQRYLIHYQMLIGDVDGNMLTADWSGESTMQLRKSSGDGLITDDKAMGKAHTYAHKYFLIHLFKISTVDMDDLDKNAPDASAGKSQQKQGNQRQAASQNKPAQGKPDKSKSLDPDDHLGKKDEKAPILFQTKPIVYVETKAGKKEGDKNYMVAGGFTLFTREPFRQLGYDEDVVNQLGVIGKHKLLEEEAFIIVYRKEGNKSIPVKMIVVATEQSYDFK